MNAGGTGDGAILHGDYSLVSSSNPAHRGETVQIFLTGLGKTSPPAADGTPGPSSPLSVTPAGIIGVNIDGQHATVTYSGLAALFPGIDQINVQVPQSAASGDVSRGHQRTGRVRIAGPDLHRSVDTAAT